jgi:hypothetical protein
MIPVTWTWGHILIVAVIYWVVLAVGRLSYISRPAVQVRARARDFKSQSIDTETGDMIVSYEHSINIARLAAIVLGPPALLVILWLAASGRS